MLIRKTNLSLFPCAKQTVIALAVAKDGTMAIGDNGREHNIQCRRATVASGEGYHHCVQECKQTGHAEINAIREMTDEQKQGAIIFLFGHNQVCKNCQAELQTAGISAVYIIDDLKIEQMS